MNPAIIQAILSFVGKYWGHLSAALCVLLLFALGKGCAKQAETEAQLAACLARPEPTIQTSTTQSQQATTRVRIVYKDKQSPCPEIAFDTASFVSQATTTTASLESGLKGHPRPKKRGPFSLSAGAYYAWDRPETYHAMLGGGYWFSPSFADVGLQAAVTYPLAWNGAQKGAQPGLSLAVSIRP